MLRCFTLLMLPYPALQRQSDNSSLVASDCELDGQIVHACVPDVALYVPATQPVHVKSRGIWGFGYKIVSARQRSRPTHNISQDSTQTHSTAGRAKKSL